MLLSNNFTFPDAFKTFVSLLYTNVSAIISYPSLVSTLPFFDPTIKLPFSVISISVTLNLKSSLALDKFKKFILNY